MTADDDDRRHERPPRDGRRSEARDGRRNDRRLGIRVERETDANLVAVERVVILEDGRRRQPIEMNFGEAALAGDQHDERGEEARAERGMNAEPSQHRRPTIDHRGDATLGWSASQLNHL